MARVNKSLYTQAMEKGEFWETNETPTGAMNGSNLTFTLAYTPEAGSLKLRLGGVVLEITNDYTISGDTITMVFAPNSGETFLADYRREV